MPKLFKTKDVEEANRILGGELPAQSTPGVMTPGERIASIGKAFGAKAPAKKKSDLEADAEELRRMIGKDFEVTPTKMAKGGKVSSASKRADGCAMRGKTKGRMV